MYIYEFIIYYTLHLFQGGPAQEGGGGGVEMYTNDTLVLILNSNSKSVCVYIHIGTRAVDSV